jgi:hypothetical protein
MVSRHDGRALPFKCSAVISDVDGTLVTNEKVLTGRTKDRRSGAYFFNYQLRDETTHYFAAPLR